MKEDNITASNCIVSTPCDDQDECTYNDVLDAQCNCRGTLLDVNKNDLCDLLESCDDVLYITSQNSFLQQPALARVMISSNAKYQNANSMIYSAGQEIELTPGFEIPISMDFEAMIKGCGKSNNQ